MTNTVIQGQIAKSIAIGTQADLPDDIVDILTAGCFVGVITSVQDRGILDKPFDVYYHLVFHGLLAAAIHYRNTKFNALAERLFAVTAASYRRLDTIPRIKKYLAATTQLAGMLKKDNEELIPLWVLGSGVATLFTSSFVTNEEDKAIGAAYARVVGGCCGIALAMLRAITLKGARRLERE